MLQKLLPALVLIFASATANADCPNLNGRWIFTYDGSLDGFGYAAAYTVDITNANIRFSGNDSFSGDRAFFSATRPYTINGSCKLTINIPADEPNESGSVIFGFPLSADKIKFLIINESGLQSTLAEAERVQY